MPQKGWAASAALLGIIVIFTVLSIGSQPKAVVIGGFAEFLIPALLTIYLLALLYSARVIIDALASFFLGRRQSENLGGKSWSIIIGYAIGAILIFILFRTLALQHFLAAFQAAVTATGSILKIGTALPAQPAGSTTNPYFFYYIAVIFSAIVLVSFALFIGGIHRAYSWVHEDRSSINTETARRETLQVVQRAARELRATDDYRATILSCYREMCRVLSLHGYKTELHETASEFSRNVSDKLGLGGDSVRGLTLLFEEARYSDHLIDKAKRAVALSELESLEQSLSSVDA